MKGFFLYPNLRKLKPGGELTDDKKIETSVFINPEIR